MPNGRADGMGGNEKPGSEPVTTDLGSADGATGPVNDGRISRLVGVYHASGTPWGEVSYWLRARAGSAHCALCDITHGSVREKTVWKQCQAQLPIPFTTVHLNDRGDELRQFTEGRTPCVVAETDGGLVMLVDTDDLVACDGSPACLVDTIATNATRLGLDLS